MKARQRPDRMNRGAEAGKEGKKGAGHKRGSGCVWRCIARKAASALVQPPPCPRGMGGGEGGSGAEAGKEGDFVLRGMEGRVNRNRIGY